MKQQQLDDYNNKIRHYVAARRLHGALGTLAQMIDTAIAPWELREELSRLREAYDYLTRYALDGVDDPARGLVYDNIVGGIMDLAGRVSRYVRAASDPSLYFSTLRYENMQSGETLEQLVEAWRKGEDSLQMAALADDKLAQGRLRSAQEELGRRLFNRLWVTYPMVADEESLLTAFLTDQLADLTLRRQLVSALLLALLQNYDERALYLLLNVYHTATEPEVAVRALTAALIAMSLHRGRRPGKRLSALLETVRELPSWSDDVKMVSLQLIRTRDTEKINRKMRDEVIPTMMKLRPDIYKKISDSSQADADAAAFGEINPEWEEMLEKSGIADKLREMQEMQEDGADVMMSTFAHLKTFPFFNDLANWFLPFDSSHSAINSEDRASAIGKIVTAAPFLCDSDKYSVMLSISRMPQAQRDMITRQFEAQNAQLRELAAASLEDPRKSRETETRSYVQSLYRFFKLFRRKGEFNDPFATSLNLATVDLLADVFDRPDHLSVVAEFYFRHGYYEDAARLFERLESLGAPSLQIYQKRGYALQQTGNLDSAVKAYRQAELLAPEDLWTMRRIASCLRLTGNPSEALEYYDRITLTNPDDLNATLMAGHCQLELGNYREALNRYFKVEYLDEKSNKALRPIAWCSFLEGDYERSADYYNRIPADTLRPGDHLNIGHLAMATRRYRDALESYRKALQGMEGDRSRFSAAMQADLHYLRRAGVDDLLTGIVLDSL